MLAAGNPLRGDACAFTAFAKCASRIEIGGTLPGPAAGQDMLVDELERTESHILLGQMDRYFKATAKGRARSSRIIPEPFFVHSDLTTGIQLADLVAYLVCWGFRTERMDEPARNELAPLVDLVSQLRYRAVRERMGNPGFVIWSFAVIDDLRARRERLLDAGEEE